MDLLRHLHYFVTVAEEQHFGRAAERLQMAQPPLSQQIRRLEAELGVELFTRTTRRVDLTPAGSAYLEKARAILASVNGAADEARRVAAGSVGHLAIGCVGSATYSLLPALSRRLAEALPGVDFSFRGEMLVADQIEALREGSVDLALLRPPVSDRSLAVTPLRDERLVVALPAGHRLTERKQLRVADLAGVDLIVHSAGRHSMMYDVVRRLLAEDGLTPTIRHEVGETSTLVTLVAGGLGAAVVPDPVRALAIEGVTYRPLVRPVRTVQLSAAHRAGASEPHLLRTLEVVAELVQSTVRPGVAAPA